MSYQQPQYGSAPPRKSGPSLVMILGICAALVVVALAAAALTHGKSVDTTDIEHLTAPQKSTSLPAPPAVPAKAIGSNGTYVVGVDIEPGTWRSAGSDDGKAVCYWARLSDLSGSTDAIIANGFSKGQQVLTVLPTDKALQVYHCGPWALTSS